MTIQDAVKLMRTACGVWHLGYDQNNRLDFRDGGETDCSALIIIICERSGLLPKNDIRKGKGATVTDDMRRQFERQGWQVIPGRPSLSELREGDVLLRDGVHTAMFVGHGQIAYASQDERHKFTGGQQGRGPQNSETKIVPFKKKYAWSCVLRFHGAAQPAPKPGMLDVDGEFGELSAKKLQSVLGCTVDGEIGQGTFTALQKRVKAPYHDGVADNQNGDEIGDHWPSLARDAFTTGRGGSASVKALQAYLGMKEKDGRLGEDTARALQRRLNSGKL